jgi:hypothetical protein
VPGVDLKQLHERRRISDGGLAGEAFAGVGGFFFLNGRHVLRASLLQLVSDLPRMIWGFGF